MGDRDDPIVVRRSDLVAVLRQLEMLVVSLDRVGSAIAELDEAEQALVLRRFVIDWSVFGRLARARSLLGDYFSREVGPDGMDELEWEIHDVPCWSASNPSPPDDDFARDDRTTVDERT